MATKSRHTRRAQATSTVFFLISLLLVLAPIIAFGFMAITSELAWYVWLLIAMGILLFIVDAIRHAKARVSIWFILLGLSLALDPTKLLVLIAVTTVCVFVDEYVIWPIHTAAKRKARINREIDKRS